VIDIRIQSGSFDGGRQLARLAELQAGAVAGLVVYAAAGSGVSAIALDHYAAMAKLELTRIAEEAMARWPLKGIILIHRHGRLDLGEPLLFAGLAAGESWQATESCAFLAEAVRARAPFWRREILAGGGSRWAKARSLSAQP
jgi:molybdopterin synthase catalytic subunit